MLKIMIKNDPSLKNDLRTFNFKGTSLLHMAAHDSRTQMCTFLVEEIEIPVDIIPPKDPKSKKKVTLAQTPLFWQVGRGTSSVECAMELWRLGADPFWIDESSKCSPFSLAIESLPDFAYNCLMV